jgi:ABC-type amino acid transport substrate-binding protein
VQTDAGRLYFTNHAFDSLIPSLKFKKYDAVISGMDITPERSKQVSFTDPYYANSAVVIAKKGEFTSFDQLKGKRIGMENVRHTRSTCRTSILKSKLLPTTAIRMRLST